MPSLSKPGHLAMGLKRRSRWVFLRKQVFSTKTHLLMKGTLSLLAFIFLSFATLAQPADFRWQQIAPGVWKATVGKPEAISLLSVAEVKPRVDALQKLGTPTFPQELKGSKNERTDGKVYLRFPLEVGEQLYGLGLNFKSVQQRGTIKTLHVDH